MVMGILPIRDIVPYLSLPHERKDFAADVSRASSLVGHNALGGGDDGNAEAAENAGQLVRADVNTQAGLADTRRRPVMTLSLPLYFRVM